LSAGPLANFYQQQAHDVSSSDANAHLQALMQALGLGMNGANLLSGQQANFNPVPYYGAGSQAGSVGAIDPRQYASVGSGVLGALAGGVGSALGGALTGGIGGIGAASGNLFKLTSPQKLGQVGSTPSLLGW
jgi:hypothetical protein